MNMFTITANNVIELLKEVTDNTLREKIIQLAASKTSSSSHSITDDKRVKDDFVLPFNRDIKELICWKIIDGMLIDLFQSIEETNTYYDAYWV
ncbi:hypothetical protein H5410_060432 [Solanum commersonii]|uniref:Uncharacterized protein n=1 Tax=Solanum commersonii TaxID=4109 RepID=A0A9J5W574_SOLCO|nr:hypothetical protein H5410_060432 [Solanum commersonii]